MISLCALLLIGTAGIATAGAQTKPTLAIFVVGMNDNNLGNSLATQVGSDLNRNSRYDVLSGASDPVKTKLNELRTQGAGNIDRNALATWGRTNGISTICLVTDNIKGNDHMFYALLIDAKDSKVSGRGSYIRTGVVSTDLPRVSLALSRQLDGPGRRRSAPAPARSYPAEREIEMVLMQGGTFEMGCTAEQTGCASYEKPVHNVKLSSFYIGKYEITQAQWKIVMKGHALEQVYTFKGSVCSSSCIPCDDQRPAESVSWDDIVNEFLPRLNALTGKKYRLPTEAEWEYAARGCIGDGGAGMASCENLLYSGGNNADELGWYGTNSGCSGGNTSRATHPVGQKKPNRLGIYDMGGNVWEWVHDWFGIYPSTTQENPTGPATKGDPANRIVRGGDFSGGIAAFRTANRNPWIPPETRNQSIGFRVALPAQ
ncbi:MAG: formylglycine-generating enzyme family protein [Prevotellaceae bacterium]|nr:formylglycine-generating enzyme family protein [Prevotellaceae bacterium]